MPAWVQFPVLKKEEASGWLRLSEVKVHGYLSLTWVLCTVLAVRQPGSREEGQDSNIPFKDALQ